MPSWSRLAPLVAAVLTVVLAALTAGVPADARPAPSGSAPAALPAVRHVFVVNLENKGYAATFGSGAAPYLSRTLRARGALLTEYYGIGHHSLPNYLAQISGQAPNPATQRDCPVYTAFRRTGSAAPGQAVGKGCVYPAGVPTVVDQLGRRGWTWRGYMEDMRRGCQHPALGARDRTQHARPGNMYAVRHDPFVYFRSITRRHSCATHVVGLGHLGSDLTRVRTTRNLSYLSPNLCHDGHDSPCADGSAGGLHAADRWLRRWVPRILASPAFRRDGLLVVTFDEAESRDSSACCERGAAPNTAMPGLTGPGGGRVGAVVVSPFVAPGTESGAAYDHYSLLRTVEDLFGLGHLGYARTARTFGPDVFTAAG